MSSQCQFFVRIVLFTCCMFALNNKKVFYLSPKKWLLLSKCFLLIVSLVFVLFLARPAQAQSLVFSDTFDEGYDKWEPTRDLGNFWSIQDSQLHGYVPMGFTISELVPKDAYWNPEWKNIRYELDFMSLAGADKNISFHFENLHNWYEVHFNHGGMEIVRVQDGTIPWSAHRPTTLQNNVQYHIALELHEAQILLYINNELIFDEIDPTFNNTYGKIGLKVGTGSIAPTHIVIDNVRVSLLESQQTLGVNRVSQRDQRWGHIEYNSASKWSPADNTINSWGCALASMVMILDFHGITHFIDTTPITPETLNAWLKSQSDGYIGNGLLNWLAVTRLTSVLSSHFQTPSLEFSLVTDNLHTKLEAELVGEQRPAIVNIPGHFLVAEGVVQDKENPDFFIQDPYYEYSKLSEHSLSPTSLRLFTPSFTDLSYFLFTAASPTQTVLTITHNSQKQQLTTTESHLTNANSPQENSQPTSLMYVQKPQTGEYVITLNGTFLEPYEIQLYTYNKDGVYTHHTLKGLHGAQPTTYLLSFNKETGQSDIVLQNKLESFQVDLQYVYDTEGIRSHFVWYELNRLITLMSTYPNQKNQLKTEFAEYLSASSAYLSETIFTHLQTKNDQL